MSRTSGEACDRLTASSASRSKLPPTPSSLSQANGYLEEIVSFTVALTSPSDHWQPIEDMSSILDAPQPTSPVKAGRPRLNGLGPSAAKRQRRDSESKADPKDKSREKNKIAAAKCRAKKRDNMEHIESSHRTLSAENSFLRRQAQELRATVSELRTLALDHQSCSCGVHQFNLFEARKIAQGFSGVAPAESRQRKHSEPSMGSAMEMCLHHNRANSFAAPSQQFEMSSAVDEDMFSLPSFEAEPDFFNFDPAMAPGSTAEA